MGIQRIKQALKSKLDHPLFQTSRSQIQIDSDIFLPPELWLEILSHISQRSSDETIAAVSLTCRSLRWIAQPLLFQGGLAIHPFVTSVSYRRLQLDSYVARCQERLDFISSPRIACHVRSLSLTPYPKGHSLGRSAKSHIPENVIVDRVFSILPLLVSLRSLILHAIKSTPERMRVLQSLSLNYFELETRTDDITWQNMPQGDTPPTPIPARRFHCNPSPHQRPTQFPAPLQFMHPDTTEVIRAGLNGTESILVTLSLSSSNFPNLRILDLQVRFVSCPQFIPALHQCPCLNTLRLRSAFTDSPAKLSMAPLPSRIIPALTTYHGPPSLASIFAHGRQIRNFKLWSSRRVSSVSKPEKVAPLLSHLGPYVETLEIGVTTLPPFLMHVIADTLPDLRSLSVNGHLSSDHTGVATMHISETPFHPCIGIIESVTLLHLDFLCLGVQIPDTVAEGSPEHENIVLDLFKKFPTEYNPTSWDQWAIDLAWSRLIWNRLDIADRQGGSPGKLSVEHVEYRNPVFRSLE